MRNFTLNIGTVKGTDHGSAKPQRSVELLISKVRSELRRIGVQFNVVTRWSEGGDWRPELIIVVDVVCSPEHTDGDFGDLWYVIKDFLRSCDQDAIAIDCTDYSEAGFILFHPDYTGERYLFDRKHFVKS